MTNESVFTMNVSDSYIITNKISFFSLFSGKFNSFFVYRPIKGTLTNNVDPDLSLCVFVCPSKHFTEIYCGPISAS